MNKLQKLYDEMYHHTQPECAKNCRVPFSCCSLVYCEAAKAYALEKGIELKETGHPKLLFMSAAGCIVPPWLRPMCTMHTCAINGLGFKPNDEKWTNKYFELREQIEYETIRSKRKRVG